MSLYKVSIKARYGMVADCPFCAFRNVVWVDEDGWIFSDGQDVCSHFSGPDSESPQNGELSCFLFIGWRTKHENSRP